MSSATGPASLSWHWKWDYFFKVRNFLIICQKMTTTKIFPQKKFSRFHTFSKVYLVGKYSFGSDPIKRFTIGKYC